MAYRIHGQPDAFDSFLADPPNCNTLIEIDKLFDWKSLRDHISPAYSQSGRGAPAYDPVILVKLLFLSQIYNLSDVQVCEEARDRISMRHFLHLSAADKVPDDTSLVRFRKRLTERGLFESLFDEIDRQLNAKNLTIKPGSIKVIDATVVQAATRAPKDKNKSNENSDPQSHDTPCDQPPSPLQSPAAEGAVVASGDDTKSNENSALDLFPEENSSPAPTEIPSPAPAENDGSEAPKKSHCNSNNSSVSTKKRPKLDRDAEYGGKPRKMRYGYKVHAAIDLATKLITSFKVSAANLHDSNVFGQLLDGTEEIVLADKGYDTEKNHQTLTQNKSADGIMRRVYPKSDELGRIDNKYTKERNRTLSKYRSPAEGVFKLLKYHRRLGRAVYLGLVKFTQQAIMAVCVHNALKIIKLNLSMA